MTTPQWIAINDRLPPLDTEVLLIAGPWSAIGSRETDVHGGGLFWVDDNGQSLAFGPSHWMPMPDPPKD